jgi:pimeloyl-ACP methyl ester carboxylesterase
VGHSYGGLLVRLFAVRHPEQVAGVVFVDAMGRDATRRQLAIWRPSEAPELRREWGAPVQSRVNLERGEALASGIRTLGDVPVVAITGARTWKNARFPPRLQRALQRLWITMHTELAALSSDHIHVVALRSNHMVMSGNQQPWVVERAVSAVVQAYRDRAALPTCTRVFTEPGVRCLQ